MSNWYTYLRNGLARKLPGDRVAAQRQGRRTTGSNLGNLKPYVRKHWRAALGGLGLLVLVSLCGFPQPLILRYVVDEVIVSRATDLLAGALVALAGIMLAERILKAFEGFYFARLEERVNLDVQRDLIERVLRLPMSFFDEQQTGYLMSRLDSDTGKLRWFFSGTVVFVLTNTVRFIGGMALLFFLEWRLALIVVAIVPVAILCVRFFASKIHVLSHQSMEQEGNVSARVQESLSSVSLIKSFAAEAREIRRLMAELAATFRIAVEWTAVQSVATVAISVVTGLSHVAVLGLGAYWVIQGHWTLGSLLAFLAYLGYVFGPARFLTESSLQFQEAVASLDRVSALFDIVPEENLGTGRTVDRLDGDVEFQNVSFSYGRQDPVLRDVSFRVARGEHVAIVGPSGVGKTTMLSLILGFYRPTEGEILFDDVPVGQYDLSSLRRRVGYVAQNVRLLTGSIVDNIRYGDPDLSAEHAVRAARAAGIHDFAGGLPEGYDTKIGENGAGLSEGQKQRLSIARALAKDPDVLVFDEPTSALDPSTERPILEAFSDLAGKKTLFLVTNRRSVAEKADRVLVLDDHRLVAHGTHDSLAESNAYYRELLAG